MIVIIRCKYYQEVLNIKALKERIWLEENIEMLEKSPKEYYKDIFKEIVKEIKFNQRNLEKDETVLC